ncbi:hypothetical protein [Rubrobacter aplysinae]|uniref:hypothetical protein n=1 Tax=Rubrobacter aplysinae TaxID=909625 RepID=UPI00128E0377|nr:hypothetical protein [Rubrobacter aplysinae]
MSYRGYREPVLWISTLGASLDDGSSGETRHEEDLPLCCRTEAARNVAADGDFSGHFECGACGAGWQRPLPVEPEFDAFTYRTYRAAGESEGAA